MKSLTDSLASVRHCGVKLGTLSTEACPFKTTAHLSLVPVQHLQSRTHLKIATFLGSSSFLFPHLPLSFLLNPRELIGWGPKDLSLGFVPFPITLLQS